MRQRTFGQGPAASSGRIASADRTVIDVSDLVCSFGSLRALNGASLAVPDGAFLGVIGPNGAGKTTLLDCISGFNREFSGTITFEGQIVSGWSPDRVVRKGLMRTFQRPRIFSKLTVLSNLMASPLNQRGESFRHAIIGGWRDQEQDLVARAWDVLAYFNLENVAHNYGSELSGGQERLVELARVLMCQPRAILLDEPFAGVSPANRRLLGERLRALCIDHHMTIVMVEHRLQLVEELCDSIAFMAEGRVIAKGSLTELREIREVVDSYLGEAGGPDI